MVERTVNSESVKISSVPGLLVTGELYLQVFPLSHVVNDSSTILSKPNNMLLVYVPESFEKYPDCVNYFTNTKIQPAT